MDNAPEVTRRDYLLGMVQKEFPSYHPLIAIARIAHHGDADLKTQLECHKTIAKYVEPELKSIEVKGEITGRHRVTVSMFEPVGASFSPVIEGEVVKGNEPKVLGTIGNGDPVQVDMDPVTIDRVVTGGW